MVVLHKAALEFGFLIESSQYFSCYLIVLQLCYNQLTGSIPTQLDSLKKLNVLALESNLLTGAIPANLGNLVSLMRLDLSFNKLFGSIPAKLADAPLLRVLDVRNNTLSGNVPIGNNIKSFINTLIRFSSKKSAMLFQSLDSFLYLNTL